MENDLTSTPTMVEEKATKKVGFRNDHSFCEDQMMLVDSNGNPLRTDILQGYASRVCSFGDSCQVALEGRLVIMHLPAGFMVCGSPQHLLVSWI